MTPSEFKQWGYRFVDWISNYLEHSDQYPVLSNAKPGDIRKRLPSKAPQNPEPFDAVLADLDGIIAPGLTHWNHPSFFAYFPTTGSEPGILGEMVTAALNVNGMLWRTSPAATELEEVVLDWLRELLGLPTGYKGLIFDTASMSTFHALAAARECLTDKSVRDDGLYDAPRLRLYASEQAHSSVEKSAMALGLGRRGLVHIATDAEFRMDVRALEQAIEADLRNGYRPIAVVATIGTTSTTSIDPVARIADICARFGLWLHVDAAYAGTAAIACARNSWVATAPLTDVARFCRYPS